MLGLPARLMRSTWRRSLLTRVVTATLVLSAVVLAVLGVVLVHEVGKGLVTDQRTAGLGELDAGLQSAQSVLAAPAQGDAQPGDIVYGIALLLQQRSGRDPASSFQVLVLPSSASQFAFRGVGGSLGPQDVPGALRTLVAGGRREAYSYVRQDGRTYLVAGAPLATNYELYYAFPLTGQEQTLALVRSRLLTGGIALVLLLGLVAGLVARQVVTPVRLAARVATRLAAGRLTERLEVKGSDDLARLATAFNGMAAGLQRQIGQLEELSRVQRRFTADVSHELRTPLTTVRMAADLLHAQRGDFAPEVARSAELLQGELDRFEALLTDLLEISRYDANVAVLEPEPVDLAGLVREQVEWVARLAADRGVTLDLTGVPEEPVIAEADPRRVSRIVRNLLANAVEHAEGRPVEVTVAADAEAVAVRVRDHGVGLRGQDTGRVFDRFWRADPSRARQSGGTGLGLSIAREDARLHGGWLQAWGVLGEGASFRLVLPGMAGGTLHSSPLALDPTADPERAAPAPPSAGGPGPAPVAPLAPLALPSGGQR